MLEATEHRNTALFWALLLAITALSVNFVFFANPPLQAALPWMGILLAAAALAVLFTGLRRIVVHSQLYRRKWLSIILAVLTLIVSGMNLFVFFHARSLPSSSNAPQVGQPAPDFTLSDTAGQPVSLDSLLKSSSANPSTPATKGVLLIFYRGYW